jgi:hypothetical protein
LLFPTKNLVIVWWPTTFFHGLSPSRPFRSVRLISVVILASS